MLSRRMRFLQIYSVLDAREPQWTHNRFEVQRFPLNQSDDQINYKTYIESIFVGGPIDWTKMSSVSVNNGNCELICIKLSSTFQFINWVRVHAGKLNSVVKIIHRWYPFVQLDLNTHAMADLKEEIQSHLYAHGSGFLIFQMRNYMRIQSPPVQTKISMDIPL